MKPILSAEGLPINWVNYKTGVKHIFFKMDVTKSEALISIEIVHPAQEMRKRYYEQFTALKQLFFEAVEEDWKWEENVLNEHGISLSRISKTMNEVSIFNQNHWPKLISFLKPRIIALDQFWIDVKPIFEAIS